MHIMRFIYTMIGEDITKQIDSLQDSMLQRD